MKLKTVLLAGLVSAAGALSASAADVFSVNAVGFVNVTVPQGQFAIISNPLNASSNTLPVLLPNAPNGITVWKFDIASQGFTSYLRIRGAWTGTGPAGSQDTATFNPGEAFFVQNPGVADVALTFVGEVAQGTNLTINIPSGFSMLSPQVPQSAPLTTGLGLNASNGDTVYFYRRNTDGSYGYQSALRIRGAWSPSGGLVVDGATGEPVPNVGEGFFLFNSQASKTWVRSFSANN